MPMKQLDTLLKFEKDKENQSAKKLQAAETEYQQNILRLESVSDYRLEYMKRLSQRAAIGLDSSTYSHYHTFISKLDYASEQVKIAMHQAKSLVEQCRGLWLKQRQKVQAVEVLREKRRKKFALIAMKKEQKEFDEMATQQFIRRKLSS
ncbi:MAG: flagellar export protein FliJ [Colwellia sp.]